MITRRQIRRPDRHGRASTGAYAEAGRPAKNAAHAVAPKPAGRPSTVRCRQEGRGRALHRAGGRQVQPAAAKGPACAASGAKIGPLFHEGNRRAWSGFRGG